MESLNSQENVLHSSRDQRSFEERRRLRAELQQAIQKGHLEENPWLWRKAGEFSGQPMSLLWIPLTQASLGCKVNGLLPVTEHKKEQWAMWLSCFCVMLSVMLESIPGDSNCLRGLKAWAHFLHFLTAPSVRTTGLFFLLLCLPCCYRLHPTGNISTKFNLSYNQSRGQTNKHVLELKNKMT